MPDNNQDQTMQHTEDGRTGQDRREKTDRRHNEQDWTAEERRENDDRRSYVGRRQAAAWRRQEIDSLQD